MNKLIFISIFLCFSFWAVGQNNVQWTNMVNTTADGNTLTKTGSNGWNAGGSSTKELAANSDGYAEITINQDNTHRFFGLSANDASVHFTDIDFAIFLLSNQSIRIYELGSYKGSFGNYAKGDRLRVERANGKINYSKNGVTLYTSVTASTSSLVVDATIYHQGGTVENAVASFDSGGGCTDADGDGVCADQDCNDNNANIPAAPGTACNDNNANTVNDVIQADGCTCRGETPACTDADNDGVCAADDCDDNNANVPTNPGTACNDNNANTQNDVIQADGCTCQGEVVNNCGVPTNLSASSSSQGVITFKWSNEGASEYHIQYRISGGTWQSAYPTTNQHTVTSLSAGIYQYRVRARCGAYTNYTSIANFTLTDPTTTSGNDGLWTDGGDKIYHTGKVLIGPATNNTLSGDFNLYVTKGILSERMRVRTVDDWADYVFEKDYPLNKISFVEQHIKTNKHLPNVPSAKEVEKEGFDLSKMDATLLRQIEELWLHTIELNKKVQSLEEELKQLKEEK